MAGVKQWSDPGQTPTVPDLPSHACPLLHIPTNHNLRTILYSVNTARCMYASQRSFMQSQSPRDDRRPPFVADLIPLVLELAHWWPRDLLSLCTVSSCWLYYVRRELYRTPALTSYPSCSLLSRTLRDNLFLRPLVKGIHLRPTRLSACHGRIVSRGIADTRSMLCVLGGLSRITFGGDLAVGAERLLNALPNPEIVTYLHIDGTSSDEICSTAASLEWDETLAYKFSALRTLKLSHLELDVVLPLAPLPEVVDLTLDHISLSHDSLIDMFSGSPLKKLSIMTDGTVSHVEEQVQLLLESSCIEELHYEAQWNRAHALSFMPPNGVVGTLRRLSLVGTHTCAGMVETLGRCFPRIRKLFISGRATCITAEEWENVLKSSVLPCLQNLDIPNGTSHPPYRKWGVMEEALVARQSVLRNVTLSFTPL